MLPGAVTSTGGGGNDASYAVATSGGTIFVSGSYFGAATISGTTLPDGGTNGQVFVAKYTEAGAVPTAVGAISGGSSGAAGQDIAYAITASSSIQAVTAGFIDPSGAGTFGSYTTAAGNSGFFGRVGISVVAPTVTTTTPTTIAATSAVLGGNVTADGGATVTDRGVVYVVGAGTPTTSNTKVQNGTGAGTFSQTVTGLTAGTQYTVRAYAINSVGTSYGSSSTFTTPAALATSGSQTNVSCNGGSNGTASVNVTGGLAPYTYSWNTTPVQTTATITGLVAGNYIVTVTDASSATITRSFTITQPPALNGTTVVTTVACFGGSNGAINLTPSGGTGPYTFLWNNGATTEDRTGLAAGAYSVTITDANSCTRTISNIIVTQPSAIATGTSQTNIACFGGNTGAASVSPSGGAGGYTYSWSTGATTQSITGLVAGNYSVTITDANGCTLLRSFTITQPGSALAATTSQTNVTTNGGTNGSATITVSGGTPGYTYSWSPNVSTTATASNLSAGTYTVTATDANGCTIARSFTITQPTTTTVASVTRLTPSPTATAQVSYRVVFSASVTGRDGEQLYGYHHGQRGRDFGE